MQPKHCVQWCECEPELETGLKENEMTRFKKILFPTDFSANANKALAHAVRLAGFDDGEIIVQHVVGDYFEKHSHWATLFDVRELQKSMDGYVAANMAKILPGDVAGIRM